MLLFHGIVAPELSQLGYCTHFAASEGVRLEAVGGTDWRVLLVIACAFVGSWRKVSEDVQHQVCGTGGEHTN